MFLFLIKWVCFVFGSIREDNLLDKNCQSDSADDDGPVYEQKGDFEVRDTEDSVVVDSALASSTSKYEFSSEKHISGFIEGPKTMTLSVQELFLVSNEEEESVQTYEKELSKLKEEEFAEDESSVFTGFRFLQNYDYHLKDFSPPLDSEKESTVHSGDFPTSYDSFGGSESESVSSIGEYKEENIERVLDLRDQRSETDDEFIELELQPPYTNQNRFVEHSVELAQKETEQEPQLEMSEENLEEEYLVHETGNPVNNLEEEDYESDSDDDEFFSEEHEELLEQLKNELKLARTGGLPTIDEESESPKMVDELKPLKIDHKFERKDHMLEIHKFYKRYLEKTRKLDVLNSQTMHAIGTFYLNGFLFC